MKMERVRQNATLIGNILKRLRGELNGLERDFNAVVLQKVTAEHRTLQTAVLQAKNHLVRLETEQGIKQVPLPNTGLKLEPQSVVPKCIRPLSTTSVQEAPVQEKKTAKPVEEPPVDVGRLDFRIGRVEDVQKHPNADSLYVLKVNCGEAEPRTVCSGLVKHVPMSELENKDVVVLCNLKAVKMRGVNSEAMVMCASGEQTVEVLQPPSGCKPGDLIEVEGYKRQPDAILNPKKKIFETVATFLATNDAMEACYEGKPLTVVNKKGKIVATTLTNTPVK